MSIEHDWRVHPGEVLEELLGERNISQTYLAWATGYSLKHVNRVIKGHNSISAPMAVGLEDVLGQPDAEFWLRLQMAYDLHVVRWAARGLSGLNVANKGSAR